MSGVRTESDAVKFFPSKGFRPVVILGVALGIITTAWFGMRLISGDIGTDTHWPFALVQNWLGFSSGLFQVCWFGWMGYTGWWKPLVRITSDEIEYGVPYSRHRQRLRLADVVGVRWQDSFDLRLSVRSGREHSIPINGQIDRQRLETELKQRIGRAGST